MKKYTLAKNACYLTGVTMAITANLSPILFLTFKDMYNVSFTLLGFLSVINFCTQLFMDVVFAFFAKHFNIHKMMRITPLIVFIGMLVFAIMPMVYPENAFLWIAIGTAVFSVGCGFISALASPIVAAIPSENPEREMSRLHAMYPWGVVAVIILSTLFIAAFGGQSWMYLVLLWSVVPLVAFIMFLKAELPYVNNSSETKKGGKMFNTGIMLCGMCIFFGAIAEFTMSQWASGFIESALGISKVLGDACGVALFAVLLALVRTFYSGDGKKITNVLLFGMIGAAVCYFVVALSLNPVVGLVACILTGLFTAMMWPGGLICLGEYYKGAPVAVYVLMAIGEDSGATFGAQLFGIISDNFATTQLAQDIALAFNIGAEQVGMRAGLFVTGIFCVMGVISVICLRKYFKKRKEI